MVGQYNAKRCTIPARVLAARVGPAWEAATLARMSAGRSELGLGAGHTPQEYLAVGRFQDWPAVRKRRLMESFGIIQRLLRGEVVTSQGEFFETSGAQVTDTELPVPLLIDSNGEALLRFAGRHSAAVGRSVWGERCPTGTGTMSIGLQRISIERWTRSTRAPVNGSARSS